MNGPNGTLLLRPPRPSAIKRDAEDAAEQEAAEDADGKHAPAEPAEVETEH